MVATPRTIDVLIRLATPEDGGKLWALVEEYIASQVAFGAPDQRKILAIGLKYGIDNDGAIVVAEHEGEIVGFVAWTPLPNCSEGEAVGLGTYVVPAHRSKGWSDKMRHFAKQ